MTARSASVQNNLISALFLANATIYASNRIHAGENCIRTGCGQPRFIPRAKVYSFRLGARNSWRGQIGIDTSRSRSESRRRTGTEPTGSGRLVEEVRDELLVNRLLVTLTWTSRLGSLNWSMSKQHRDTCCDTSKKLMKVRDHSDRDSEIDEKLGW